MALIVPMLQPVVAIAPLTFEAYAFCQNVQAPLRTYQSETAGLVASPFALKENVPVRPLYSRVAATAPSTSARVRDLATALLDSTFDRGHQDLGAVVGGEDVRVVELTMRQPSEVALVMLSGRERMEDEYAGLLSESGLRLARTIPITRRLSLIEAFAS